MSVLKLADYLPKKFSGNISKFSMNVSDIGLVICIELENESIQFFRVLDHKIVQDLNQMLLNTIITNMPIFIDATFMNAEMYEINDIGFYEQD